MKQTVPISTFKATCLRLLDDVNKTGKSLLITRNGEPIALVSPPPAPPRTDNWIGFMRDRLEITGDVVSPASDEAQWEVLDN
ncbi:MAG: type II toxin-antitoxin system Phd/YefM family antitoxin [Desulfobacteraceae bacterium]